MVIFCHDIELASPQIVTLGNPMAKKFRDSTEQEVFELRRQIEQRNYQYYVLDHPLISDAEYDRLFRRLTQLEKAHLELATAQSPTQNADAPPEKLILGNAQGSTNSIVSVHQLGHSQVVIGDHNDLSRRH